MGIDFLYRIVGAIKYHFKREITKKELNRCNILAHGGLISWRTYGRVLQNEVETRIRAS